MDIGDLLELSQVRKDILSTPTTTKQMEIANKLDELILTELNKLISQETA